MSSSNWPLSPVPVRAENMKEGRQSWQLEITGKLLMANEKASDKKAAADNDGRKTEVKQWSG